MRYLGLFLFLCMTLYGYTQPIEGRVAYERRAFWVNIYSKLPYLSQEQKEKELALYGNRQGNYAEKYFLDFSSNVSFYHQSKEANDWGWSWKEEEVFYYRDLENKTFLDKLGLAGKDYIIKGDTPKIKWKIQNEIREVAGYLCQKATTIHPLHDKLVVAWYSDKIPVSTGPEGLGGLPGLILMLEYDDELVIEATEINLDVDSQSIELPKKIKGKQITFEKYREDYWKLLNQSIKLKRNPYWQLRI